MFYKNVKLFLKRRDWEYKIHDLTYWHKMSYSFLISIFETYITYTPWNTHTQAHLLQEYSVAFEICKLTFGVQFRYKLNSQVLRCGKDEGEYKKKQNK